MIPELDISKSHMTKTYGQRKFGEMGPNVWKPQQTVKSVSVTVDPRNYAKMKDRELKSHFGYRDWICDKHEDIATNEFKGKYGIKDPKEFKNIVNEYSRVSGSGYHHLDYQCYRLKKISEDPLAHYELCKRREKHPVNEKFDDFVLNMGLKNKKQTNINLSVPGTIRRERRIYEYDTKISQMKKWMDDANYEPVFKDAKRKK